MSKIEKFQTGKPVIKDQFGRVFTYLRLSVTDRCNLACHYCNPTDMCAPNSPDLLSWDDFSFIVQTSVDECGLKALRLTGGEPTVRPGLINWIREIRDLSGLEDISMTTNGVLLGKHAKEYAEAGLNRVNISLDTWNSDQFRDLTRGGNLSRVLEGIDEARKYFNPVKINCVALRSNFSADIDEFLEFASNTGIEVRFIELMPIFDQKEFFEREFISTTEMQDTIVGRGWSFEVRDLADPHRNQASEDKVARIQTPGFGPASRLIARKSDQDNTSARLGFISQMSDTKCLTCNKLRITSDGSLKPCLLMPEEIPLRQIIRDRDKQELVRIMTKYFLDRAESYTPDVIRNEAVPRGMQAIGG